MSLSSCFIRLCNWVSTAEVCHLINFILTHSFQKISNGMSHLKFKHASSNPDGSNMTSTDQKRKQRTMASFVDPNKTTTLDLVHIALHQFIIGTASALHTAQHPLMTELLTAASRLRPNSYLVFLFPTHDTHDLMQRLIPLLMHLNCYYRPPVHTRLTELD